ncbi:MAG: Do family serine endopeptidase [Bacteroidetes bacterium]|nr:Do family serine endopeptidase [Bacteroidota bacterium]
MKKIITSFLFALTGGIIASATVLHLTNKSISFKTDETPLHFVNSPLPNSPVADFTQAAELTLNSVVHIKTLTKQETQYVDPFQGFFFGNPYQQRAPQEVAASGSGVIISADGYIATNNHVVNGASEIEVTLNDNSSFKAKVIGVDPTTDLALIKVDAENLTPIYYGNSDDVKVGQWVVAVGNPFNLTSTVTAGIVSAKGRNIHILQDQYAIESFIQTDAAVNPGNSGGALVNTRGELIGINTAIASNTGSYTGYAFAIPSNMVKKITSDLLQFGKVQRAMLGIQMRDIDQKLSEEKNLKGIQGAYINSVFDNSSAKEGGLEEGDIITKIGTVKITKGAELQEQISQFRPGDKITVTYLRDGKEKVTDLTLKNTNGTTSVVEKDAVALGAKFEVASKEEMQKLRIDHGVKISELEEGKLRANGIKQGFIITQLDNEPVKTPEELSAKLKNKKGGVLIEGVYPNGMKAYYGFGL